MKSSLRPRIVLWVITFALILGAVGCTAEIEDGASNSSNVPVNMEPNDQAPSANSSGPGLAIGSDEAAAHSRHSELAGMVASDTQDRGIWVTGSGVFEVEPDMAVLRLGVSVLAETIALAQERAGRDMSKAQEAAFEGGVARKDIQTVGYSIRPEYHYEDVKIGSTRKTKRVLDGYRVTNNIVVKLREMGREGAIIDSIVEAGADSITVDDISFVLDDAVEARVVARERAVIDATNRATQIADSIGVEIGRPIYVRELSATSYQNPMQEMYGVARAYEDSTVNTPIAGGVLDITVTISAVFSIEH